MQNSFSFYATRISLVEATLNMAAESYPRHNKHACD